MHETPTKVLVFGVPMMFLAQLVGSALGTLWTSLLQLIPSLYHTLFQLQETLDKKNLGHFKILLLDENSLILKITKTPLFSGKNQERFEVRYFSRIK